VAAAIGLVPTVLGGVRRLPGRAVRLPVYAVGHVLTTVGSARREYDALAERGEQLISKLRGTSFDEVEDAVEDALQDTPFAKPYDVVEDALEDAGEAVTQLVRSGRSRARGAAGKAGRTAGQAAGAVAEGAAAATDSATRSAGQAAEAVAHGAAAATDSATRTAGQAAEAVIEGAATASRTAGQAAEALADGAEAVADTVRPDQTPETARSGASAESIDTAAAPDLPATGPLEVEAAALAGLDLAPDSPLADLGEEAPAADAPAADVPAADAPAADVPDAEAPKGVPTPKATEPDSTRISTAASSEVVEVVERISATVGGPVLEHGDLPLPDYDHMTLGSLRGRMRSLDLPELIQIRDYEKAHADRLPIVTMLDNRIAKLANDPTAPLSGSPADAGDPPAKGKRGKGKGGSKVTPNTASEAANNPDISFGGLGGPHRGD
jgi:hypothetical protein